MANRIDQAQIKGAAVANEFNRQFKPNTPCFYQPIRGEDKWYPTRTRSEAWLLGHGEPVVKIDGASGCVCISHLAMPGSDRYEASIAEAEEARGEHNANWVPFTDEEAKAASRPKAINVTTFIDELFGDLCKADATAEVLNIVGEYKHLAAELQEAGEFGDGYHTFTELYAHRVRLFSSLMHAHKNRAWWSHKHSDDSQWDGWIIAGIQTPDGMVTYHLPVTEIENLPDGCELPKGKEWDGHTADDVLLRLTSLSGAGKPIALDEQEEQAVYHYAASVNLPQGQIHYDGIIIGPMISSMADYMNYRAQIAADAKANVDQVQVHSMSIAGVKGGS